MIGTERHVSSNGTDTRGSLTAAQVADLAPGTSFRLVELFGKVLPPFVGVMIRRAFPPGISPVRELLTDGGMPVPARDDENERGAFDLVLKMLDDRGARFEVVG
jgi:hypothetical protein